MADPVTQGVYPADLIVWSALTAGLEDLRARPEQLDDCFRALRLDPTTDAYGGKEALAAKDWFLSIDVPVVPEHRMESVDAYALSVSLVEAGETEVTLGDTHFDPYEDFAGSPVNLAGPFDAVSWSPATGVLVLPATGVPLNTIVLVVDATGTEHRVQEVLDDTTVVLTDRWAADYRGAYLRLNVPTEARQVESVLVRETVRVGVHAHGDPVHLLRLYAVVRYLVERYRRDLFEARGYERVTASYGPAVRSNDSPAEAMHARYVTLTGYCRDSWAQDAEPRVLGQDVTADLEAALGELAAPSAID